MTPRLVLYALAVISVVGLLTGIHYIEGNYWRNKLLAERPDTSKTVNLPQIIKKDSAQTLTAQAKPHPPKDHGLNRLLSPLKAIVGARPDPRDSVIAELLIPREATVTTSKGETIEVTYDPGTDTFTVVPQPLIIIQPTERLISHNIPEVEPPTKNVWIGFNALNAQGAAILGTIGYKQVGFTVGIVQDKLAWGIGLHFSL